MLDNNNNNSQKAQLEVLLTILILFIFKSIGNQLFSSRLIYFLTILGINTKVDYLYIAKNYLYILTSIVYYIRVFTIEKLLLVAYYNEQIDKNQELFLYVRDKYLANSLYSLISKVISLLAYSKYIIIIASNLGNAYQLKDKRIFYLNS